LNSTESIAITGGQDDLSSSSQASTPRAKRKPKYAEDEDAGVLAVMHKMHAEDLAFREASEKRVLEAQKSSEERQLQAREDSEKRQQEFMLTLLDKFLHK
jgi:hypothetical protein